MSSAAPCPTQSTPAREAGRGFTALRSLPALLLCALVGTHAVAADIDFYRDLYPILKANCISCHNKTTTKGGLNMESPELMKKGGETGVGLVPGKGAESLIVKAAERADEDLIMPPKSNNSGAEELTKEELELLRTWIDQGAKHSVQQARKVAWQSLPPGVSPIYTVSVTGEGRYAACGRGNKIFLYDLATRQLAAKIGDQNGIAHRAQVQSLAFSPDGQRLASGSFREVKVWKAEPLAPAAAGEQVPAAEQKSAEEALLKKVAAAAKSEILVHALAADGKLLACGCADGVIRVWDAAAGKLVTELRHGLAARAEIAALERNAAAMGLEQTFHKAETARIEAQNKALDELLKKAQETIVAMKKALPEKEKAVKPAQETLAVAQKAADDLAADLEKAPDGKPDAALEARAKDVRAKLANATAAEASAVAAFAAVEHNIKDAETDVERITASKAKNAESLAAAAKAIESAAKEQAKATADLAALKKKLETPDAKPAAVAMSRDGSSVAALFDDGRATAWGIASGAPVDEVHINFEAGLALGSQVDGSFGISLPGAAAPRLLCAPRRWVLERTIASSEFADRINAVRFSPDGATLAVGGGDPSRSGDMSLWDVKTGKLLKSWPERHSDSVLALDFSPDGKLLASGGADKIARITEIASGRQVNLFEGHTHYVMGVAFRADGRVLATAGADGAVLVWDMLMGERKKKIEGWTKEVTSIQFIGATPQLLTSAGENLIRIVNDDGTPVRSIAKLPDFMQSAVCTPMASLIVGGGEDSFLRLWDSASGKELASFGPGEP